MFACGRNDQGRTRLCAYTCYFCNATKLLYTSIACTMMEAGSCGRNYHADVLSTYIYIHMKTTCMYSGVDDYNYFSHLFACPPVFEPSTLLCSRCSAQAGELACQCRDAAPHGRPRGQELEGPQKASSSIFHRLLLRDFGSGRG